MSRASRSVVPRAFLMGKMFEARGTAIPVARPSQHVVDLSVTVSEISANWKSQIWAADVKISSRMNPMIVAGIE